MTKHILNLMLACALVLGTGLPVFAQQTGDADQAFAKLDADKDGKLSPAEFGKMSMGPDKPEFEEWDADGDGSISKDEFAAQSQYSSEQTPKPSSEN